MVGKIILAAILISIAVGFAILYHSDRLYNLNYLIPQKPDISCKTDSDCRLTVQHYGTICSYCGGLGCKQYDAKDEKIIAINKNWKPFCPFPRRGLFLCSDCMVPIENIDVVKLNCINNKCVKYLKEYKSCDGYTNTTDYNRCIKIMAECEKYANTTNYNRCIKIMKGYINITY